VNGSDSGLKLSTCKKRRIIEDYSSSLSVSTNYKSERESTGKHIKDIIDKRLKYTESRNMFQNTNNVIYIAKRLTYNELYSRYKILKRISHND
jgi:hypothetical protein